jgi:hypothetical protein
MTTMTMHGSATALETPHVTETTTISDALRRRAQSIINDNSVDPRWRAVIRYGLEINDPWLPDLVRRADAGEKLIDSVDFSLAPETNHEDDSIEPRIEALAEIICRAGEEPLAALFVLMGTLESSAHPKVLANAAKHYAFIRCGELNLFGIVDAQIAVLEGELLANMS